MSLQSSVRRRATAIALAILVTMGSAGCGPTIAAIGRYKYPKAPRAAGAAMLFGELLTQIEAADRGRSNLNVDANR